MIFLKRAFQDFNYAIGGNSPAKQLEDRNHRIVDPDKIDQKLKNHMDICKNKMQEEKDGRFKYTEFSNSDSKFSSHLTSESGKIGGYFFNLFGGRSFGLCHAQGRRPSMEDQHIAKSFNITINGKEYPVELFGVFDGHWGPGAALYIKDQLALKIQSKLELFNKKNLTDADIFNALKLAFFEVHDKFGDTPDKSGSTATVAMILDGNLWIANTGDSRTILQDANGKTKQLSEDAKPDDIRYKKGIEKRGGFVEVLDCPRINGRLAVGRAIGDYSVGKGINPRPKITKLALSNITKGSRLILACDGIYDVASSKQIGAAILKNKKQYDETLAKNIVYSAYNSGSTDNLSALFVTI